MTEYPEDLVTPELLTEAAKHWAALQDLSGDALRSGLEAAIDAVAQQHGTPLSIALFSELQELEEAFWTFEPDADSGSTAQDQATAISKRFKRRHPQAPQTLIDGLAAQYINRVQGDVS